MRNLLRKLGPIRRRDNLITAQKEKILKLSKQLTDARKTASSRKRDVDSPRAKLSRSSKQLERLNGRQKLPDEQRPDHFRRLLDARRKKIYAGRAIAAHPHHALLQIPFEAHWV